MRRYLQALTLLALALITPVVSAEEAKLLRAIVAIDGETPPATTFANDVPQLYAYILADNVEVGDSVRGVWIAEDVGEAAPKNHKIAEQTLEITSKKSGGFKLTKPTNGWPVGQYRVELYVGDKLAETVKFKIQAKE